MPACIRRAVSMFTDFLTSDDLEATARRTGFVKRTSTRTGQLLLPLVTLGTWREAQTTLAPWAAQGTPLDQEVAVSPAALQQRLHKKAMAFLQERSRQARAKVPALEHGGDADLFTSCTQV